MDWFLYDRDLRHETFKPLSTNVLNYFNDSSILEHCLHCYMNENMARNGSITLSSHCTKNKIFH